MLYHRQEKPYKLRDFQFLGMHANFLDSLIDFKSIKITQIEVVVVFAQEISVLLRIADHIVDYLLDHVLCVFFFFHLPIYII